MDTDLSLTRAVSGLPGLLEWPVHPPRDGPPRSCMGVAAVTSRDRVTSGIRGCLAPDRVVVKELIVANGFG